MSSPLVNRVASIYLASERDEVFALPADTSPKAIEAWLSGIRIELNHDGSALDEAIRALVYNIRFLKGTAKSQVQKELDRLKAKRG